MHLCLIIYFNNISYHRGQGFSSVVWHARFEKLNDSDPAIFFDGSHNPQGMQATVESLQQYFPGRKLQFIFGVMADKELDAMVSMFLPLAKKVYITAPAMPRAMKAEELFSFCKGKCNGDDRPEFFVCPQVRDALKAAMQEEKEEVIVVIGSLYLVGEVKRVLA